MQNPHSPYSAKSETVLASQTTTGLETAQRPTHLLPRILPRRTDPLRQWKALAGVYVNAVPVTFRRAAKEDLLPDQKRCPVKRTVLSAATSTTAHDAHQLIHEVGANEPSRTRNKDTLRPVRLHPVSECRLASIPHLRHTGNMPATCQRVPFSVLDSFVCTYIPFSSK